MNPGVGIRLRHGFVLSLLLIGLFIATRLTNLTKLPIFTDEAIYVRWAQIGTRDASWRFISMTDGKQPLFTWVAMTIMRFVPDPLYAGRLVSVLSGVGSALGIFFLSKTLFKSLRVSFLSSFLYIISPFSLVYDRMALYDSLVAMFSLWNLYFAVLLVRTLRLDVALIFGMTLGLGMLNKTSGFLSLYLAPLTMVLMDWRRGKIIRRIARWALLLAVSAVLSQAVYGVLRLSPFFHMIAQKDAIFVYPFREWISHPTHFFVGNMRGLIDWLVHYLTWPVTIAAFVPAVSIFRKPREKLLLYGWWLAPFVALALFGKVLYPRFVLFMSMPLLILAATTIDGVMRRWPKTFLEIFLIGCIVVPSVYTDYLLITNPIYAPIPQADRGQYINDWPAGWGVSEVASLLAEASKRGHIVVYTEGTFGLLPYGLEIMLVDNPNIEIHGIWPVPEDMPQEVARDTRLYPTYFVMNQRLDVPRGWPLTLVASYPKGIRKDRTLRLYSVSAPLSQDAKVKNTSSGSDNSLSSQNKTQPKP